MLSSKTYVFEDDLTRCWSVWLVCFFLCVQGKRGGGGTNANAVSRCCEALNRVGPVSSLSFLSFPHLNLLRYLFTYACTVVTCFCVFNTSQDAEPGKCNFNAPAIRKDFFSKFDKYNN